MIDPYQIATQEAGLIEPAPSTWITVSGTDARKFLNGLLTNDIQSLQKGSGCYNALCTPKGKMLADLFCYDCGDFFGIDADYNLREKIVTLLKKYIIFNKVELVDESEQWKRAVVIGPTAKGLPPPPHPLPGLRRAGPQGEGELLSFPLPRWERGGGEGAMTIQKICWNLPWIEIWSQNELTPDLPKIPCAIQEILRIESGTPLYGVDMDENTIPQEANLHHALNFNKGCYVGQETIARLEHRGHVGKKLVQLKLAGDKPPARGTKIISKDGQEVGIITSACFSPKHNSFLALGYLRYQSLLQKEFWIGEQKGTIL